MAFFFLLLFFFLLPHESWAWGPIAHVDYAATALEQISSYSSSIRLLLSRFPYDFLYGSLAADITLGKDYVDYVYNCHNWKVGFSLFDQAREDREKAACLGYLTHLSVDTISHNYFVPYQTMSSYPTRTLGHVYWEMRFDSRLAKKDWDLANKIARMQFPHDDDYFEQGLRRTLFSFKTNKRIFRSVLTLHKLRHWKALIDRLHRYSRFPLLGEDVAEYRGLAVESAISFLTHVEKAPCTRVDPTGAATLEYADHARSSLKTLVRAKTLSSWEADLFLKKARVALRESLYTPSVLPSVPGAMRREQTVGQAHS